ncbi:HD domain protein [Orientia tsutsugamushi str. TA716]|uniref:HD domain protein n=1 Tax=Orientia tsutsugamushi str. TA716 TaxID=1359175 RepID=A0A0F3P3W5_ORITS|nr:HD domain protein [Orientia tsutsugamushi str. TA716]KJV70556.1 HD domain protein [Orientia tsutsugamushi str. TA716]KJV70669.1 HD domain protein [Orientia tsutsugamushi str. TA716]KJV70927.1 HD domain protein [Orientia tsutsugamushi str. TA716]KJV73924.1 HD domain protein [Orientia tsutsugamushi str. TA716]
MIDFYSESLINKLFRTNVRFNTKIDLDKVERAIKYAKKYHGQQKRDTGELYYTHPLKVAYMVSDYTTALKQIQLLLQYYMIHLKTQN